MIDNAGPTTDDTAQNRPRVIILGAGPPYRGADPSALAATHSNRRTLDWTFDAFNRVLETEFHFVGGYRLEDVVRAYPNTYISVNPNWETQGSLGSLMAAPLSPDQTTFVCYSDIVFSGQVVQLLNETAGDVVVVADRGWKDRYEGRSTGDLAGAEKVRISGGLVTDLSRDISVADADAEFIGLFKLSPAAVRFLVSLRDARHQEMAGQGLPRLVQESIAAGLKVVSVEIDGGWAELNAPQDLARFVLGTKADTLERLRPLVRKSVIGEQVQFTVGEWRQDKPGIMERIKETFAAQSLAIRSSALAEDGWTKSNAGQFTTVLDIPEADPVKVDAAIEEVAKSYGAANPNDQILVQSMLSNVVMHGVVLTRTLIYNSPYYTLNYDDSGLDTIAVTSGQGNNLKTAIIHRHLGSQPSRADSRLVRVLEAVQELELHVGHDALDVEFAITAEGPVHVLQLRPIAAEPSHWRLDEADIGRALQAAAQTFEGKQIPSPFILGRRTIFGIMPDWNPAEIIGPKPRRLALSLYQYLVTDEIWAAQRAEYGYRDVRPQPLMIAFAGHPYIDVRACFNSFVPASVPDELAERLVEHYLDRLDAEPNLHDKVEFSIVFTCMAFDFAQRSQELLAAGFTKEDVATLRTALTDLTEGAPERCQEQLSAIDELDRRYRRLMQADMPPVERAFALLEDCRRFGTLPFAHLARAAFVATSLVRSLETIGVTNTAQTEDFLQSLSTVSGMFEIDGHKVASGNLPWPEFVERYGHLRPGTYEVTSPSYAEDSERYLRPMVTAAGEVSLKHGSEESVVWDESTRDAIQKSISTMGLSWDVETFENFLRQSIEGREYAKFIFSRNLSVALADLVSYAETADVDRGQLAHISIGDLLSLHTGSPVKDINSWLTERADEGERWHQVAQAIELPSLLVNRADLFAFERHASQPNFVTSKSIVAEVVNLAAESSSTVDLNGKIVLIPQADPGFDWLFGHQIAGLITMYGGANSHMTIRAAEFGLPAAIGVGEVRYDQLASAAVLKLDCAANWVQAVR